MKNLLTIFFAGIIVFNLHAQDTTRLSLLFLGDIMQHDSQISDAYNPLTKKYDYRPCFQFIKPYTQNVDLAIGNFELTLAGPPYKGYPQFSAPDELLVALKDMGMDILVTANNHCVDRGKVGLERTIEMLDSLNIKHTGTFVDDVARLNEHPLLVTKNGFDLAILNYTYGTNGLPVTAPNIVNMIDTTVMRADLEKAKTLKSDIIIVFTHWGSEYQSLPSQWQKTVTEFCFRNGAQLVIGAHPHVVQPMEWRKENNQLIAYSLGNFVSGQRKRYTDGGAMITLELEKISFGPDHETTAIDTANYILEWVYRTAKGKDYFVLPVPEFEQDTSGFILDDESKTAFKTFADDSRNLFRKHNLNVEESRSIAPDSLTTYKVSFLTLPEDSLKGWRVFPPIPYGVETIPDGAGNHIYYSGEFLERKAAEKYSKQLAERFGFRQALVTTFVNGRRRD